MRKHERDAAGVPARDGQVASLLDAVAAPSEPGPQPGEAEALAAFRARQPISRRSWMRSTRTRTRIALSAGLGTGLLVTGGVGAAYAGALPGAAQDTASAMLAAVGVEVPGADEHAAGHSDERGRSGDQAPSTDTATEDDAASGKGGAVSDLARGTDAEGVDKGAEISGLASGGKSQAGQHGGSDAAATARPDDSGDAADQEPPVEAPNDGGTDTADDATTQQDDGASTSGTTTADGASSGHSTAGSGNRP